MITERQEKLLDFVVKEYLGCCEPVSSRALQKASGLDVSAATIRNDLQELTKAGYIEQPHTSAGRIPTQKAYQHFAYKLEQERAIAMHNFVMRQVEEAHQEMETEMQKMQEIMRALEQDNMFDILKILDTWHKRI